MMLSRLFHPVVEKTRKMSPTTGIDDASHPHIRYQGSLSTSMPSSFHYNHCQPGSLSVYVAECPGSSYNSTYESVQIGAVVTPLPTSCSHASSLSLSSMDGLDKAFKLSLPTWSSSVIRLSYSLAASISEYLVARSRLHKAKHLGVIVLGQSLEEVPQRVFNGICDCPT